MNQTLIQHAGLTLLSIPTPAEADLAQVRLLVRLHPLHAEDVLSHLQRPKLDEEDEGDYLFLVLHIPTFDKTTRLTTASEIDLVVASRVLIATYDANARPMFTLMEDLQSPETQARLMSRGVGFLLYSILEALLKYCFPMVYRLDQRVGQLQETIFKQDAQKVVEELSYLRRDVISLRRILHPNFDVIESLALQPRPFLNVDEDAYFGDLTDNLDKLWDMLEEQKEMIEGLDSTIFNWNSYRLNREMKTFTLISVIFLPLTLVASILGMNVVIPFGEHPLSLVFALAFMAVLLLGMLAIFRRNRWL